MKCPWDDDEEITPDSITNYYFEDGNDEPVSYSVLPLLFSDDGDEVVPQTPKGGVFLHGEAGIAKFHRQVKAWRVDILGTAPEVLVLTKDDKWVRLVKPRRSFAEEIRKILIVVRCLHYLRRKPYTSEKFLWEHCRKVFSLYDFRPSEADVVDHLPLISMMMKKDEVLAKSKVLAGFLEDKPKKRKSSPRGGQADLGGKRFIVGDDEDVYESLCDVVGNDDDEESDLFDTVCAICDNGGELLCCEGICMRSFHPTIKAGGDSYCLSLGYTDAEVEAIQNFLCRNCQFKKHQCFICGKLGSSDKSVGAEVFQCSSVTCGHFYHSKCVAELLHPGNEAAAAQHQKKIASGESFTCPLHKCIVCKRGENKEVEELQFAICRRCPKAYHRKCLPETIAFEDKEKKDIVHRAWDDLLPNCILIYCLKHPMDEKLRTPIRNHIEFPDVPDKRKTSFQELRKNVLAKTKKAVSKEMSREETEVRTKTPKILDKVSISVTKNDGSLNASSGQAVNLFNKQKAYESTKKPSKDTGKSVLKTERHSVSVVNKITIREDKVKQLVASKGLDPAKHTGHVPCEIGSAASPFSALKESHSLSLVDKKMEKKINDLLQASSSLKLEDIINRHEIPSTHVCFAKSDDKTITLEKVEGSVEDVRTALQKLKEGCSIEDAKAVCEPEIVNQIIKWKNKFKDYLAPFLHGLRYTSFDRHFTKKEKLQEIVEKLHWYVHNGDMIVDFCCGANDFSCFMKQKLDEIGKKCLFKNYDIIQPKNDFDFVKKDWLTVQRNDLNKWSELIIVGLNPPFGVKAALANKFIDKALQFKPKLLILIVPEETERLDKKKRSEYDLIWEDCKSLSGKCFYLPGSFDTKNEQWNVNPPVLYLWSHKAWSQRHRTIAEQHGHASRNQKEPYPAYEDQAQETHKHPVVDPVLEETTLSKETHKHLVVDPVLEETTLSKHISQPDHNMCDRSRSTKQKKRRRERPMRAKKAKKIRVARRSDNSGQGPQSQESCHLMHKHNSSVGPLNPVRVGFTEDSHSSGFDASSMSSTPAEERFPRYMGGGAGFADRGPPFTGLHDPRMGAMHVAQCCAPPRFEMNFGRSAATLGDLYELPWCPCSGGYSSHPGGCVHGRFGSVGWLDE